jgi:hypothetical protein
VFTALQQVAAGFGAALLVRVAARSSHGPVLDAAGLRIAFVCTARAGLVSVALAPFVRRRHPNPLPAVSAS